MLTLGQGIYLKRIEKGMTQLELVKKTGIQQPNLSNIEKGKKDITLSTFLKICWALGVRPGELLEGAYPERTKRPFLFSRSAVERIARVVVHGRGHLGTRERALAERLRDILPAPPRSRVPEAKIFKAWMELRNRLSDSEIKILLERIRDEKGRSS